MLKNRSWLRTLLMGVLPFACLSSASAQLQNWAATTATTFADEPADVAVDATGNVFIAGNSGGDILVAKYNALGSALWVKRFNGAGGGTDTASSLALDSAGNAYVTGSVSTSASTQQMTTLKFQSSNGAVLWSTSDTAVSGAGKTVRVDGAGNVYAVGEHDNAGYLELVTVRYDAASGAVVWSSAYNSPFLETHASDVVIDGTGGVYSLGTVAVDPGGTNMLLVKYDAAGVQVWADSLDGLGGLDYGRSLALDPNGFIYAAGQVEFFDLDFDMGLFKVRQDTGVLVWEKALDGYGNNDDALSVSSTADGSAFLAGYRDDGTLFRTTAVKFTAAGSLAWQTELGGTHSGPNPVSGLVDAAGNFVVVGSANSVNTRDDFATYSIDPNGTLAWSRFFNDDLNGNDRAAKLAIDSVQNLYVTGLGFGGSSLNDAKTVRYQRLSLVAANSTPVGGSVVSMTLSLNSHPALATAFQLSSSSAAASVPVTTTVSSVANSVSFNLTTTPVTAPTPVVVKAINGGASVQTTVTLLPASPVSLVLTPGSVAGGGASSARITLSGPAPAGGVSLSMGDNSSAVQTPGSATVSAGTTFEDVTLPTTPVSANVSVNIFVTANGVTRSATLAVTAPVLVSLTVTPGALVGGVNAAGSVVLSGPAPIGGAPVTLSSNQASVVVPSSVTVAAGANTASFNVAVTPVAANVSATVTATRNAVSKTSPVTVLAPVLFTLALSPNSVTGGVGSVGTVGLNGAAPTGGATVTLSSNLPAAASVPASVLIAAGSASVNFAIVSAPVTVDSTVTVLASRNGATRSATITVLKPVLSAVMITPTTIRGGTGPTGLVLLSGTPKAGTAGVLVSLSSDNPAALSLPSASARVAAGATSAEFLLTSHAVAVDTLVTITGTAGVTRTATVVVTP